MKFLREFLKTHLYLLLFLFLTASPFLPAEAASSRVIPPHHPIQFYETQRRVDYVLFLIQKRLCIMHEVARTKWNQGIPIEDKPREQQLLAIVGQHSKNFGIDVEWSRKFFQAQFDAAKALQINDYTQWTEQGINKFDTVLDLKIDIRPYIDIMSDELLTAVAKIYPDVKSGKIVAYLPPSPLWRRDTDCLDNQVWNIATAPLYNK